MKAFTPLVPPRDIDGREVRLWLQLNGILSDMDSSFRKIDQGFAPGGGNRPITTISGAVDHGALNGLVQITNTDGSIQDFNDDHDMYAHLPGRLDGQVLHGSRFDSAQAWVSKSGFSFDSDKTSSTSWTSIAVKKNASVGDLVVIALSTDSFTSGVVQADTTNHSTITDSQSNTWTRRKERTEQADTGFGVTTSLWTSIITTEITTADTLTATFISATAAKTIQAYVFEVPIGATISIAGSASVGQVSGDTGSGPSLSISGLVSDTYLFIRADGIERPVLEEWGKDAGYRQFSTVLGDDSNQDRIDSTTTGGAIRTNNSVRAEFNVLETTSSSTQPTFNTTGFPIFSSVAIAIQLTSVGGNLKLRSIDSAVAATIELDDTIIRLRAIGNASDRLVTFEDEAETELSYIRASDGAFVGSWVPGNPLIPPDGFLEIQDGVTVNQHLRLHDTGLVETLFPVGGGGTAHRAAVSGGVSYELALSNAAGAVLGTEGSHALIFQTNNIARLSIAAASGDVIFTGNLLVATNEIRNASFIGIGTSAATPSAEDLHILTAVGAYGLTHDDGTTQLSTFVDATAGWIGTVSNHPLNFFAQDGGPRLSIESSPNEVVLGAATDFFTRSDVNRIFLGASDDASLFFNGTDTFLSTPTTGRLNIPSKAFINSGNIQLSSTTNWLEVLATPNSTIETSNEIRGLLVTVQGGNGIDKGRNFAKWYGARAASQYIRTQGITYASNQPQFVGGDFRATYSGSGVISGTGAGSKWSGGEFIATVSTNKTGATTLAKLRGGNFEAVATAAMANVTIVEALAGRFKSDVSGAGVTVTNNYGILIEGVAGGSNVWGLNLDGTDMQISSDNYLILEGNATTKGDTRMRWNSATSEMEFDINGVTEMVLKTGGLIDQGRDVLRYAYLVAA